MKIDIILPPPTTALQEFEEWQNRWRAELIPMLSVAKRIEVKNE